MEIRSTQEKITSIQAEAVVVGLYSDSPPSAAAAEIDQATGGSLTWLIESQEFSGKKCETVPLYSPVGVTASQVLVVGLGEKEKMDCGTAFQATATAARQLSGKERGRVAFYLDDGWNPEVSESGICGADFGCQGQDLYRSEKKYYLFDELLWAGATDELIASGTILGYGVNLARRLVNEPPAIIYPESFAQTVLHESEQCSLEIEIWDQKKLEEERCGALLGVSQGSTQAPRLVIMRHTQGGAKPTLALVGKGVTFDSGGLSLKPSEGMKTMKCDMAGAAAVLGAMVAISHLELPVNVIGLVGLVENMVSGSSYKLGDVLTARNGKTIEVLNTDAEGRLVLADVLSVAVDQGAAKIIDLATLTGACVVALGTDIAGLMTNNQALCDSIAQAAKTCGEPAWQLPMFEEFSKQIRSEIADIKNIGEGRWGGAITAAKFLEEFVDSVPWTHIDIAGPSFLEKSKPWCGGGGTGTFVRTLVELARQEV